MLCFTLFVLLELHVSFFFSFSSSLRHNQTNISSDILPWRLPCLLNRKRVKDLKVKYLIARLTHGLFYPFLIFQYVEMDNDFLLLNLMVLITYI